MIYFDLHNMHELEIQFLTCMGLEPCMVLKCEIAKLYHFSTEVIKINWNLEYHKMR